MRVAALVTAARSALRARRAPIPDPRSPGRARARRAPAAAEHRGDAGAARNAADRCIDRARSRVPVHHRQPTGERPPARVVGRQPVEIRPRRSLRRSILNCRNGVEIPADELPCSAPRAGERVYDEVDTIQVFDDGSVINTLVSAMPLYDVSGHPRGAVGAILDMTELKRAELALREADRRKDEFLAMLAHELRNPLAPIRNALADPAAHERARSAPRGASAR